jgi:hypothetical protein
MQYPAIKSLPRWICEDIGASLKKEEPISEGVYRLVKVGKCRPGEDRRIKVNVLNEEGYPEPGVMVVFAFTTGRDTIPFHLTAGWQPPPPYKAKVEPTQGDGATDLVLGPEGVVKKGQRGGVTVYLAGEGFSSDVIDGLGMYADHTSPELTFQKFPNGYVSRGNRLDHIEDRLMALETEINELKQALGYLQQAIANQ